MAVSIAYTSLNEILRADLAAASIGGLANIRRSCGRRECLITHAERVGEYEDHGK